MATRSFKGPRGTRDMYPEDMLRRRYLLQTWRDTSIRHGFEEIEGPTFEEAELYAVKSGEGILGELFQAFSGKSPEEVEQVMRTGRAPFAMRPEFTPTLARMYAARAANLPRPTRWFMAGPFFRAERPQRGRLREFLQWNCDVLGNSDRDDARPSAEADTINVCIDALGSFGLQPQDARVHTNDRDVIGRLLGAFGVPTEQIETAFRMLDSRNKLGRDKLETWARDSCLEAPKFLAYLIRGFDETGVHRSNVDRFQPPNIVGITSAVRAKRAQDDASPVTRRDLELEFDQQLSLSFGGSQAIYDTMTRLAFALEERSLNEWFLLDTGIVRGLAYYTGTVFEVIAEGERAVAGGGRYDNLIELLGGPPTPAVGFAMGDVVLSLLLEDKGLMPQGPELMDALSRRPASLRPEAFVIGANDEASDAPVRRLVADLRRGVESPAYLEREGRKPWHADRYEPAPCGRAPGGVRPMHARASDKSTRNLKKLLNDAERQFARFAVILHGDGSDPGRVQIKDMDARKDLTPADIPGLPADVAEFSADPASPVYAGRAIAALTRSTPA